jgi:4-hydroxybenzoate polyprenyltransferase
LRWGSQNAALIASLIYILLIGITWIPFFTAIYNIFYALALLPVNGLVLYVLWQLHHQRAQLSDDRLGRLLKIGMFSGLLAIVIGELAFDLN